MPYKPRSFSGSGSKKCLSLERKASMQEHEAPLIADTPSNEIPVPFPGSSGEGQTPSNQYPSEPKLSLCRKLAYGMGGPPMQLVSNCMAFFFTIFILETAGVNAYYNSVIQFTARVWDAITDPVVGYLVTKTNTRFGRLRPWLICSAPFGIVSFFMIFYVPDFQSMEAKFAFYLISVLVLQTSLTTFHVPYSSMTMVLTSNVRDRDLCSAFRMGFELLGLLLGVAVFGSIIGRYRVANLCSANVTINETDRYMERVGYMGGSSLIGFIFLVCTLIVFFGSKERNIHLEKKENYLRSLRNILTFQPYLRLMFAFLFCSLGLQTVQSNLTLYVTHTLKMPKHMIPGILTVLVMAVVFIPVAQGIIVKLGKKTAFASGLLMMMPIQVTLVFIPENPHWAVYYFIMAVCGYTISVAFLLPWSMLPDAIDAFTLQYGVRKEAAFYSFYVFFNKFAVGISCGLSSFVLGLVGYDVGMCTQPEAVGTALRYLMGPTSTVCFTISLFCLYLYPINEDYRMKVKSELAALRRSRDKDLMDKSCATIASTLGGSNLTDPIIPPTNIDLEGAIVIHCNGVVNLNPNNTRV